MTISIIVTEATEMHGNHVCIAGWDAGLQRIVRPLPGGANWTGDQIAKSGIRPSKILTIEPTGIGSTSTLPHSTEDLIIEANAIQKAESADIDWFGADAPPTAESLHEAYDGFLEYTGSWQGIRKGAFVPEGSNTSSLVALRLHSEAVAFVPNDFDAAKLRVIVDDGTERYNLPVVSRDLLEIFRAGGVDSVQEHVDGAEELHVRIGLSRAWDDKPDQCFAMLNGINW